MARNRQRARDRKEKLRRENVPGSLDHASGEVEEVEAAIVAGAEGEPLADEEYELDDETETSAEEDERAVERDGDGDGAGPVAPPKPRTGPRLVMFLRACVAELQRVQWPDRRQTGQATAVVLGFVLIAGAFLGGADFIAQEIIEFII